MTAVAVQVHEADLVEVSVAPEEPAMTSAIRRRRIRLFIPHAITPL